MNNSIRSWGLAAFSSAGVVTTAILAAKASPKAVEKVKEDSRRNHEGDPYAYTKKEAIKSAFKFFVPALTSGVATIGCILGSTALSLKQQKSLATAYGIAAKAYNNYTNKVKEIYGKEAHERILSELGAEKCERQYISAALWGDNACLDFGDDDTLHVFYFPYNGKYFETTIPRLLEAEYHLNRNYVLGGIMYLSDFYNLLGLKIEPGEDPWWDIEDEIYWIEFDHKKFKMDNGEDCYLIDFPFPPHLEDR